MYLLHGVSISIFVLIRDYRILLSLDGFPNATALLSLSFEYDTDCKKNLMAFNSLALY